MTTTSLEACCDCGATDKDLSQFSKWLCDDCSGENQQLREEIERLKADNKQLLEEVATQHAAIEAADAEIGRLLAALKSEAHGHKMMTEENEYLRGRNKALMESLRPIPRG